MSINEFKMVASCDAVGMKAFRAYDLGEGDDHVADVPVELEAPQLVEALHPQRGFQAIHHLQRIWAFLGMHSPCL